MTNLTPEAVKAALDGATPGPWRAHCDEHGYTGEVHGGIGSEHEGCIADWVPSHDAFLIALAPDLARDWLRLKEVEKAGKALAEAAGLAGSIANDAFAAGSEEREGGSARRQGKFADRYGERVDSIRTALAAFRTAVEGK